MIEVRHAAGRLVRAETKYDQRIICALLLAVTWVSFWMVQDWDRPRCSGGNCSDGDSGLQPSTDALGLRFRIGQR